MLELFELIISTIPQDLKFDRISMPDSISICSTSRETNIDVSFELQNWKDCLSIYSILFKVISTSCQFFSILCIYDWRSVWPVSSYSTVTRLSDLSWLVPLPIFLFFGRSFKIKFQNEMECLIRLLGANPKNFLFELFNMISKFNSIRVYAHRFLIDLMASFGSCF